VDAQIGLVAVVKLAGLEGGDIEASCSAACELEWEASMLGPPTDSVGTHAKGKGRLLGVEQCMLELLPLYFFLGQGGGDSRIHVFYLFVSH
jgi:hypothetical protein